ncbi:MAG: DNA (cytosine-5-)-methyltransferase [Proteobacteria bacterium]|nr:MAG: DNA (cytosine-5-)-methyltransferase [Pseudomonadota bacterium]
MRPLGIDLFAGAGGLSLGFEQAGFDVVAAVEVDPVHCATHKFNFPDCAVICKSVTEVSGDEIRQTAGIGDAEVGAVFGGSPCQGYSMIGKRALDDPRNSLVNDFVRIVREVRPQYFVFENVPGLTVGKHSKFLEEIIEAFKVAGYRVLLPYRVLKAKEFGVPQDRRRLFLVGAREDMTLPSYPVAPYSQGKKGLVSLFPERRPPTVWDAIGDLPDSDQYPELWSSDEVLASFGNPTPYSAALRGIVRECDDLSHPRSYEPNLLTSSTRTRHTQLSVDRFAATKPGSVEPISRFLRLDPQGLCNTLRAGTGTERGAFTSPRPVHPFKPRVITVREAARLHSYPDWFRFHTTKWHGFRQVGNSVPPLLGRAVASEIAKAMGIKPEMPHESIALGDRQLLTLDMRSAYIHFGLDSAEIPRRTRQTIKI